jgi:hypothetical protein
MSSEYHTPGELATPCRPSDHHSYAGMFSRGMGWRHTSTTAMQQEIQPSHTHTACLQTTPVLRKVQTKGACLPVPNETGQQQLVSVSSHSSIVTHPCDTSL